MSTIPKIVLYNARNGDDGASIVTARTYSSVASWTAGDDAEAIYGENEGRSRASSRSGESSEPVSPVKERQVKEEVVEKPNTPQPASEEQKPEPEETKERPQSPTQAPRASRLSHFFRRSKIPEQPPQGNVDTNPTAHTVQETMAASSLEPQTPPEPAAETAAEATAEPIQAKRTSRFFKRQSRVVEITTHSIITSGLPRSSLDSDLLSPTSPNNGSSFHNRARSGSSASLVDALPSHPDVASRLGVAASPADRAIALLSLDDSLSTAAKRRSGSVSSQLSAASSCGSLEESIRARQAEGRLQGRAPATIRDHYYTEVVPTARTSPPPHATSPVHTYHGFKPTSVQKKLLPTPDYNPLTEPTSEVMQLASALHQASRSSGTGVPTTPNPSDKSQKRNSFFRRKHTDVPEVEPEEGSDDPDPRLSLSTSLFRCLAEAQNHRGAKVMLGLALRAGWGCPVDELEGLRFLKEAAGEALEKSQEAEGGRELEGRAELQLALYEVANAYAFGLGITKDPKKALEYYEIAGALGDVDAMNALGDAMYSGQLQQKKSKFEAAQWYRKAEKAGGTALVGNSWIWKDKYDPK